MSLWAAIKLLIVNLPAAIEFIQYLAELFKTTKENKEKAAFVADFLKAYKKAVETGDTSDLEDLFKGGQYANPTPAIPDPVCNVVQEGYPSVERQDICYVASEGRHRPESGPR